MIRIFGPGEHQSGVASRRGGGTMNFSIRFHRRTGTLAVIGGLAFAQPQVGRHRRTMTTGPTLSGSIRHRPSEAR